MLDLEGTASKNCCAMKLPIRHSSLPKKIKKSPKSEFAQEIKKLLKNECPADVPFSTARSMIAIDFMGYARKVPVKKMKIHTYAEFCNSTVENIFKPRQKL